MDFPVIEVKPLKYQYAWCKDIQISALCQNKKARIFRNGPPVYSLNNYSFVIVPLYSGDSPGKGFEIRTFQIYA